MANFFSWLKQEEDVSKDDFEWLDEDEKSRLMSDYEWKTGKHAEDDFDYHD